MKKLALLGIILLLVVCGCGKKYTLEEQQAAFKAWNHEFIQKGMAVQAVMREEAPILWSAQQHTITPAEAKKQLKPLNEKFEQTIQTFDQLPDTQALNKEDQQTLKDYTNNVKEAMELIRKSMYADLDDLDTPNPHARKAAENDLNRLKENSEKIQSKIKSMSTKLKVPLEDLGP